MLRGLPFHKGGRLMVGALREIFFVGSSFCLNLLLLVAPPAALVRTRVVLLLSGRLLHAYVQNEYRECMRDEMT
jgi:hypothetical protein